MNIPSTFLESDGLCSVDVVQVVIYASADNQTESIHNMLQQRTNGGSEQTYVIMLVNDLHIVRTLVYW